MKGTLLILVLAAMSAGCSASYQMKRTDSIGEAPTLDAQGGVYVSLPQDGQYSGDVYAGSGLATAQAVVAAFSDKVASVACGASPESEEQGLATARANGCAYLIALQILHWEDRATEWSGKPDRVEILLRILEVGSGELLDSVTITGKSKWATFGGDHPQDLLVEPIGSYVSSLY